MDTKNGVTLVYDYGRLKERIRLIYGNQKSFASDMGVSLQTVNNKLNGRYEFGQSEILAWAILLSIGKDEIFDYFFCRSVV